ncbi:MAG TPA: TetR/AcrR family transcriptional regulator [Bryobacteraceae bacterium]|nr:TetR/AcrR family transcriptional regulator [Bryobacteraceae bacterium]
MGSTARAGSGRRTPKQKRSRQTVQAILDAVVRLLKREGAGAVTTNRIAEVAGVSIGSLYQYFPDKQAIFSALHERHIQEIDQSMQTALVDHASSALPDLLRAIVDAMIDAHARDPELHALLSAQTPPHAEWTRHFAVRLHGVFRLAIAARARELKTRRNPDKLAFVAAHMVESLSHGAMFRRPPGLSLAGARAETVRAILAYLRA